MKKTTILGNGTGNSCDPNSRNTLLGDYLKSLGSGQTVVGRYNAFTSDSSSDLMQIGAGLDGQNRVNAVTVKKDGEIVFNGGGEVYMTHPLTLEIVQVYMTNSNNRIKKVYLSR